MKQKRDWKRTLSLLLLTSCLLCTSALPTLASQLPEEISISGTNREDVLRDLMNTNPEDALEPITQRPDLPEASQHKEFSWQTGFSLSGIFETQTLYFKIPDYWQPQYVYAQVAFTLSQMIQDVPASLTFLVNGQPVYSCKLDYRSGRQQLVYVPIPVTLLRAGFNTFDVTGYVRIYDDEGCIDDFSGANWVYIDGQTFVEVGYELLPHNNLISCYPYPFMSTADPSGSGTQVLLSDALDAQELSAALLLRADLASEAEKNDSISLLPYAQRKTNGSVGGSILVSKTENLPKRYRETLTASDSVRLENSALVSFLLDETGAPLLLVTSESGDCLMEAAMMLTDESRVSQEHRSQTWVTAGSAQLVKQATQVSDLVVGRYTVDSLTDGGVSFFGPFHHDSYLTLPFSGGYVLSDASKVVLKFRYSKNLDFDRSLVTVFWGNVPVASKKLTAEAANDDELSFFMPADVLGTNASSIRISFDLELPDLFCTPRMDEMPWAYVTGDSSFYFPMGTSGELSFKLRPFPFEVNSSFHALTVVIPDNPTTLELDTLGQILSLYGEAVSPYGDISVVRAGDFDETHADRNIITIGTYADNSLIRKLNGHLSFPYEEEGRRFASTSSLILSPDYAQEISILQLLRSPYSDNRAILVASAVDAEALGSIHDFICIDSNVWKLDQDAAIFDRQGNVRQLQMLEKQPTAPDLSLRDYVQQNKESILFAVISTSGMLLLLLATILIFSRMYGRGKKSKK